jgi:protein-L-isoaspartate O-methyltransferase
MTYTAFLTMTDRPGCNRSAQTSRWRFVGSSNYASAFGLQWNRFQRTRLDSYTGTTISRDRLTGALGGSLDVVRDKSVLEAGCGAGRFTEVLLFAGHAYSPAILGSSRRRSMSTAPSE